MGHLGRFTNGKHLSSNETLLPNVSAHLGGPWVMGRSQPIVSTESLATTQFNYAYFPATFRTDAPDPYPHFDVFVGFACGGEGQPLCRTLSLVVLGAQSEHVTLRLASCCCPRRGNHCPDPVGHWSWAGRSPQHPIVHCSLPITPSA